MMQPEDIVHKLVALGVENVSVRAEAILAGAAKASKPTHYVNACLWRLKKSRHPSSKENQQRARAEKTRAERAARRERQQHQRQRLDQLAVEATEVLRRWLVEIPACSPQWEACLASLGEVGWAPPMAERLGVSCDVLFARKRRGMLRLLAAHPHLADAFRHHGRQLDLVLRG